ncbi:voltage-gated shaker-like K+ channel [Aspergillus oryzae 100-8]|uniref:Voltage-gated shaker-like K+ channel, subunit beta/KCNAB n=1 Tax=Aspergillus oryzae (strain 3.042) TaxID=1160506 RepID=I8TU26_ASPO3|nr:voltage-gated shaker-like K+ channel, subunit beta/KCNAB [Aspergillus oryzae 3.042]KDE83082.1 voltage-gated shaker-like K+ channel [Aspergillus oryzae 100-8]|eukprot:EIT77608.1 voltage-gated shaker-like K+ channel, subunit beta/KCNAB [Aspergillus oryzae 3.042]
MPLPVHPPPRSPLDRHRQLAPSASVRVTPLCLGAMNFGDAWKDSLRECPKETAFKILDYFITQRQNRDQLVLASKFSSSYKNHESDKLQSTYGGNGGKSMRVSLELSLQKLQTSYIHLFYLHWSDYTVSIPELMHTLPIWWSAARSFTSGFLITRPGWLLRPINTFVITVYANSPCTKVVSFRGFEREILPMYRDENMGEVLWGTLSQGQFHTEAGYKEREQNNPGGKGRHPQMAREQTDLTSIALAYVRHKAPYVFPVVGGRKVEHLRGNIAALDLSLSVEEMAQIEAAYPFDHGFPHTFLSGTLFDGSTPRTPDGPGACG